MFFQNFIHALRDGTWHHDEKTCNSEANTNTLALQAPHSPSISSLLCYTKQKKESQRLREFEPNIQIEYLLFAKRQIEVISPTLTKRNTLSLRIWQLVNFIMSSVKGSNLHLKRLCSYSAPTQFPPMVRFITFLISLRFSFCISWCWPESLLLLWYLQPLWCLLFMRNKRTRMGFCTCNTPGNLHSVKHWNTRNICVWG